MNLKQLAAFLTELAELYPDTYGRISSLCIEKTFVNASIIKLNEDNFFIVFTSGPFDGPFENAQDAAESYEFWEFTKDDDSFENIRV